MAMASDYFIAESTVFAQSSENLLSSLRRLKKKLGERFSNNLHFESFISFSCILLFVTKNWAAPVQGARSQTYAGQCN